MAKVLVIRASSFGDVAMLVPVIFSVAAKYPQDRFTVMTRKAFSPLFENLSFNINVMPLDVNKKHKGIRGLLKITGKATAARFTHVVDVHDVLRSKIIRTAIMLSGKKVAHINKGREEKKHLIETKQLVPPLKHTTERYMEVFEKLGFGAPITFNNFFDFIPRDFSRLYPLVTEKKGKWIGVAPFARHKGKIYPLEKTEQIVEILSKEKGTTVFLLGAGKEENKVLTSWEKKYPNVINTTRKFNLERELLLISYFDVMLSMDSANMHLASLVQTPVVSIWGATHPSLGFYGFRQDINNAVQTELYCRPCAVFGELPCQRKDYACLEMITPESVIKHIHKVIDIE
ncbi:MAG: glycosyltransferase family 9 protein [Prevotella sp.]|jgi:ADP-heptose:LPS heptosyltransferase|nr:glycosyltransferase family 9 protein [Prevotella sp.]